MDIQQKYWIFLILTILTGLYLFSPTADNFYIKSFVEFKVLFAPLISIINLMIVLLIYMWYKILIAGE